jgi:hypothetical protein
MRVWCLLLVVAACRHVPAVPPLPSEGGPLWVELVSPHFTLWTDAGAERGRALLLDMERHRAVVLGVGFDRARPPGRSFVVALRDADEIGAYMPPPFAAYAWGAGRPVLEPMILLSADAVDDATHVVAHELTHVISFGMIRNQPRWFAEGLASFFASVEIDGATGRGTVGGEPPHLIRRLRERPPQRIATLFACDRDACMDHMFYATAWALFAYLENVRPADLLRYAARLDELPEDEVARAWTDVFPDLTPDRLDAALRYWIASGDHEVWRFTVKLDPPAVRQRVLGDADVHAVRALLRFRFDRADPRAREGLAAALAADPTHVLANLVAAELGPRLSPEVAQRIADAHPDDWRAWWLVVLARNGTPEAGDARDRVCALVRPAPAIALPPDLCAIRE